MRPVIIRLLRGELETVIDFIIYVIFGCMKTEVNVKNRSAADVNVVHANVTTRGGPVIVYSD